MRRVTLIAGIVVVVCAAGMFTVVVWVDRALAAVPHSQVLCMNQKDRQKIAAGTFPSDRRDYLVSKALNFDQGVPRSMSWWHLRGAAIQLTYVSFWSRGKRDEQFNRLASGMRDCPSPSSAMKGQSD